MQDRQRSRETYSGFAELVNFNPMDLSGHHILVTGASSGIGRQTAILLSRLGARVTISGRNQEQLDLTLTLLEGLGHHAAAFDLNDVSRIPAWIKEQACAGRLI